MFFNDGASIVSNIGNFYYVALRYLRQQKLINCMLKPDEQKLFQERIDAYKRMIRYCEQEIAKLQIKMPHERCCFNDNRKRLPIKK